MYSDKCMVNLAKNGDGTQNISLMCVVLVFVSFEEFNHQTPLEHH